MLSKVFTGSSYFFNLIIDNDKINQSFMYKIYYIQTYEKNKILIL